MRICTRQFLVGYNLRTKRTMQKILKIHFSVFAVVTKWWDGGVFDEKLQDQIRWGIAKAVLETWTLLKKWLRSSIFFYINLLSKVSEYNLRIGISGEDREPGFPLPKNKKLEPFSASLSLISKPLTSKSKVSSRCWVRDRCSSGFSWLCFHFCWM